LFGNARREATCTDLTRFTLCRIMPLVYTTDIWARRMGRPTALQLARRENSHPWHGNLPTRIAETLGFKNDEFVESFTESKIPLILREYPKPFSCKEKAQKSNIEATLLG